MKASKRDKETPDKLKSKIEMSTDASKYRNKNETEKEWFLKKLFIEKYHDQYDEARLLCLAQCYANVETLGCT